MLQVVGVLHVEHDNRHGTSPVVALVIVVCSVMRRCPTGSHDSAAQPDPCRTSHRAQLVLERVERAEALSIAGPRAPSGRPPPSGVKHRHSSE